MADQILCNVTIYSSLCYNINKLLQLYEYILLNIALFMEMASLVKLSL